MRFGVCCDQSRFAAVAAAGFDYAETAFNQLVSMDDAAYSGYLAALGEYGLKSEACNLFFTSATRLFGPEADPSFLDGYVKKGMERAARAGCKVAVIGSGGARSVPDGFSFIEAVSCFSGILKRCGEIAGEYGIKVAVEPLCRRECNFVNTVAEGIEISGLAGRQNVGITADFYHMYENGETLGPLEGAGERLFHVHLARANDDRSVPYEAEDLEVCRKWAAALKKCGYSERISLECKFGPDFSAALERARPALELFK